MRKHTLAGLCGVGFAVLAGLGCDDGGKPKAPGEGGSPPPENSGIDKNPPKMTMPPGATGGPGAGGPPKRGGAGAPGAPGPGAPR
jgi:hypothetical protein